MSIQSNQPTQGGSSINIVGKLPKLSPSNLSRVAVFLVQGSNVLLQSPVTASGTFQFRVSEAIVIDPCLVVILGPRGLDDQTLLGRSDLPKVQLSKASAKKTASANKPHAEAMAVEFSKAQVDDKLVEAWWLWCRAYTVSGTVQTAGGCPAPGATVTVYNVSSGVNGLVKTPIVTVQANAEGKFTAVFNWCECLCCWPCWPIWWHCWPWWWEWDILSVIENIERQILLSPGANVASSAGVMAPLKRPTGPDLMTGQGFVRESTVLQPDAARTALIVSKFANPVIRERFPWMWWCCDNPNLVFSAQQNGYTIVDENPATSTRWCFASGQSVTLVGNSDTIGVCPPPIVCDGFAWTSVGSPGIQVTNITNGYANGTLGTDASNMAFAGTLNIYGGFSDPSIPFYQVWAGLWGGNANPARGGFAPSTSQPLSVGLSANVTIYRAATSSFESPLVTLGPCSCNGVDNLYMTTSQRLTPPAGVTGLGTSPAPLKAGDIVCGWSPAGVIVSGSASALIDGNVGGGVDLTAVAYDASVTELALKSNNPLTLMIDTSGLSAARIDPLKAYDASNNQVNLSGSSTTICPSYQIGPGGYVALHVTVTDADPSTVLSLNEHLYKYQIQTQFGNGSLSVTSTPAYRGYAQPSPFATSPTPGQFNGVDSGYGNPDTALVSFVGGGDTIQVFPTVSCCYDFQLWVGKRVTDGETFFCTWGNPAYQTATIDVSPIGS